MSCVFVFFFFFKQKTAYEMRISDWSSDVCSSDLSTIAPWAKLNTPEALKISTKPSATSEYSTPVRRPPSSTSRNGPMGSPSVAHAEIGVDDLLVGSNQIGRATCRERVCQYVWIS